MSFKDEVEVFLALLLTAFFSSKMNILTLMLKSRKQKLWVKPEQKEVFAITLYQKYRFRTTVILENTVL